MADFNSELPIRSSLPGQVLPDDVIIKIGDATNPTTQMASVDTHGSLQSKIADASGDIMGSQFLSSSYWLQIVDPANGSASGGTAASYSELVGGIYNSTLPTLTNGQQASLQLNSLGELLVAPTAAPPYPDVIPATQTITAQDIGSTSTSGANGQSIITGSPTAGSVASFTFSTQDSVRVQVTGTWTGTLESEVSMDGGTTWYPSNVYQDATSFIGISWIANFEGILNVGAATNWRLRATAIWTGTATVAIVESLNESMVYLGNPLPAGTNTIGAISNTTFAVTQSTSPWIISGTVTANQGGAPWSVTDTNFPATVDTNYGTVGASTIRTAAEIGNATGAADFNNGATDAQTLRVAANLAVAGADVSVTNPVPVTITSASSGTPIQNFQTSVALAVGANVDLTYTVPATHTFSLERIWASSEARVKIKVTINGVESYVGFNSSANPNVDFVITAPPTLTAGQTVVVNFKNIDTGNSDVYATFEGNQIS